MYGQCTEGVGSMGEGNCFVFAPYLLRTLFGRSSEFVRIYPKQIRQRSEQGANKLRRKQPLVNVIARHEAISCSEGQTHLQQIASAQSHAQASTLAKTFRKWLLFQKTQPSAYVVAAKEAIFQYHLHLLVTVSYCTDILQSGYRMLLLI